MSKYRFRDHTEGVTYRSLRAAKRNLHKVGKILKIKGYRARTTKNPLKGGTWERVMVYGENGTARFAGFCWSYGGEGPRGLVELLVQCGVLRERAEIIAYHTKRGEGPGVDWEVVPTQNKQESVHVA